MSGCVSCEARSKCDYYKDSSGLALGCRFENQGLKFVGYKEHIEEFLFGLAHKHYKVRAYEPMTV
jgi:hypothetical protein